MPDASSSSSSASSGIAAGCANGSGRKASDYSYASTSFSSVSTYGRLQQQQRWQDRRQATGGRGNAGGDPNSYLLTSPDTSTISSASSRFSTASSIESATEALGALKSRIASLRLGSAHSRHLHRTSAAWMCTHTASLYRLQALERDQMHDAEAALQEQVIQVLADNREQLSAVQRTQEEEVQMARDEMRDSLRHHRRRRASDRNAAVDVTTSSTWSSAASVSQKGTTPTTITTTTTAAAAADPVTREPKHFIQQHSSPLTPPHPHAASLSSSGSSHPLPGPMLPGSQGGGTAITNVEMRPSSSATSDTALAKAPETPPQRDEERGMQVDQMECCCCCCRRLEQLEQRLAAFTTIPCAVCCPFSPPGSPLPLPETRSPNPYPMAAAAEPAALTPPPVAVPAATPAHQPHPQHVYLTPTPQAGGEDEALDSDEVGEAGWQAAAGVTADLHPNSNRRQARPTSSTVPSPFLPSGAVSRRDPSGVPASHHVHSLISTTTRQSQLFPRSFYQAKLLDEMTTGDASAGGGSYCTRRRPAAGSGEEEQGEGVRAMSSCSRRLRKWSTCREDDEEAPLDITFTRFKAMRSGCPPPPPSLPPPTPRSSPRPARYTDAMRRQQTPQQKVARRPINSPHHPIPSSYSASAAAPLLMSAAAERRYCHEVLNELYAAVHSS